MTARNAAFPVYLVFTKVCVAFGFVNGIFMSAKAPMQMLRRIPLVLAVIAVAVAPLANIYGLRATASAAQKAAQSPHSETSVQSAEHGCCDEKTPENVCASSSGCAYKCSNLTQLLPAPIIFALPEGGAADSAAQYNLTSLTERPPIRPPRA
jgi:hypothetical protein